MSKPDEMRLPQSATADEGARLTAVAARFERQYRNQPLTLPEEVQAMPIYEEWAGGLLDAKLASPFWELAQPKKNQRCLDLGCGASFLIYPWRDWQAYFYGQDVSATAVEMLKSRGSQLNSKLFKGTVLAPAHQLNYEANFFDVAIATGWSCYYPPSYWKTVMEAVKKVLKPEGIFVFDLLNPEQPSSEDWAVLETYLGAEVFLEPLAEWEKAISAAGAKILKRKPGELFDLYKVKFE
ncbi:class I SAM-dependent methyltransferase [Oscillatoria sp. FACHB-1406]|nr:class I SAM-dependent methyltransferase [Oscillatoria sp. FACHB-1406]